MKSLVICLLFLGVSHSAWRDALVFQNSAIALLTQPLSAISSPDFDESGVVDFLDFLLFVGAFGSQEGQKMYEARYDLNGDGAIGFGDFLVFVSSFGKRTTGSVSDLQGKSLFGVSTLAKTGESIGVILLNENLAAIHHYVLEPTQENFQQKATTFAIDERTGEVRLRIEPAQWQNETYLLHVELLSQTRNKIGSTTVSIYKKQTVTVSHSSDLNAVIQNLSGPATIAFSDGTYTDLGHIAFSKTGVSRYDTFEMRAINPGEVTITGDTVFDISGDHNVLHGFIFRDISSNTKIGRTQYPKPLTIRGDHNRITQCVFYPRSQADRWTGGILGTSLRANDKVARFNRIDHCAFINRAYILLDNTHVGGGNESEEGTDNPISVRVDHNFF
ncbi:MAG: hypothetical protein OXG87_08840, partial [Gemmatimonadetes bacterium]|nr:hypothetical protein [Gemmatimonadota bacterium]